MGKRIGLRAVSGEEAKEIKRLANSRTAPARLVQRARIIAQMLENPGLSATQAGIGAGFSNVMGAVWVRRFNDKGLAGLVDEARSGRPATHDETVRSKLIHLALHKPPTLGYPFALWTLERLQAAFVEREGVHLSDSTIWTWIEAEGLRWKRQESWFHETGKQDPQFAEKRGS